MENCGDIPEPLRHILVDSMLDAIHEAILVVDNTGTVAFVNDSYCRLFHVPKQKILGRLLAGIQPEASVLKALESRQPVLGSFIRVTSSKNVFVTSNAKPLYHKGSLWGAVTVIRDITEVMDLTNALRHLSNLAQNAVEQSRESIDLISDELIGTHSSLLRPLGIAGKVAKTEISVLITGETGTGKDLLARAIHNSSSRAKEPFVVVNCASIPESLFESELFGYEAGAFSGASPHGKPGKFQLADEGTLFLDEIGELPLSLQAKLLRVIETREVDRIGARKPNKVNIRILSATNRDLLKDIQEKRFRRDLYHRLATITINLPPLRDRGNDLLLIANRFISNLREKTGQQYVLSSQACDALLNYHWPGNARQLHNVLARACAVAHEGVITPGDLSLENEVKSHPVSEVMMERGLANPTAPNRGAALKLGFKEYIAGQEKLIIEEALAISNGNRSEAMRMLKMNRKCFYDKLKKHGIHIRESVPHHRTQAVLPG